MDDLDALPDYRIWKKGKIRTFISHLATEKSFALDVATELSGWGIQGFVAHEDIEVSSDWSGEIQKALKSSHVFVGLAHPGFNESCWVQQEVGWALGSELPYVIVRLGTDPKGFPSARQWKSMVGRPAEEVAKHIVSWLNLYTDYAELLGDAAIAELAKAGSYFDAEAAGLRVEELGKLTSSQLTKLGDAYWANNQIHGSVLAHPVVQRIFQSHDMETPPKPS